MQIFILMNKNRSRTLPVRNEAISLREAEGAYVRVCVYV